MLHSIEHHLTTVSHQARRLLIGYALAWIVGITIVVITVLGLFDYLLNFDDRGVRIMATLTVIGAIAWAVARFLLPAIRYRPSHVQIAQRVEQLHPELRGRLASTVEFLNQSEDDPTAGSAELRRVTIAETDAAVDGLDWSAAIERRPFLRAASIAGVVALLAAILAVLFPTYAAVGVLRLVNPLGNVHWPRNHYLAVRESPSRIAAGQSFEIEVFDETGRLPDTVYIQYRSQVPGEPTINEQEAMQPTGNVMVAHKESVSRSFEYRVFGGDDNTMPWTSVEVVQPPQIERLKIVLQPPAYTGYAAYESPERIEAIVGTAMRMSAKVTKPLASAAMHREDAEKLSVVVSADGREFSVPAESTQPLSIEKSGQYWFELTDRDGLSAASIHHDIRAVADPPPTVSLERPAAGLFVTSSASIPLKAVVKDNLAIRDVVLVYNRTDQSDRGDQRIELFAGAEKPSPAAGTTPITAPADSQTIEDRWDLSPLNLPPGTQLTFHLAADDYQRKTGVSSARKITVVTPVELESRLSLQQASILAELARILTLERDVRSHTVAMLEQVSQVGALPKASSDTLQTAELNQRQVRRSLTSRSDGVLAQITSLMAELESNRLDSPDLAGRLQQMADTIERLEFEPLPIIERELSTAVKESKTLLAGSEDATGTQRGADTSTGTISKSLSTAGKQQDAVIAAIEKLIDELTDWSHYRGLARDIGRIRQEQAALHEQSQQIGAKTIALDLQSISSQQRADLNNAARMQSDLAGRFGKILVQMERIVQQSTGDSQTSVEAVADALHLASEQNLAGRMRDSADQLAVNRIGQTLEQQAAVLSGLDEMLDALANRREQQLSRLVKKLRDAEKRLDKIRKEQEGLQKKLERLTKQSQQPSANQDELKRELERLQREQRRLQQETERLARQLERLQAEKAATSTASAGKKMDKAGQSAAQAKPNEALDEANQAKRDLDEAQKQLAEQRRQAEQDLAHEQLGKIGDALKSLADRQSQIVEETTAYEAQREKTGGFTRAQSQSVLDLSRVETTLAGEAAALAEKVAAAEVFQLALERTATDMNAAADRLAKLETGEETQRSAKDALRRLQQVVEALKRDPSTNPPKPDDGGGGGGGGGKNQPPADKIALLAEVKLLKMMQEQVNLRTRELDHATRKMPMLTPDQRRQYTELAKEQGKLAELILKKSAPLDPLPEEDPESLPDVRREEEVK